MITRRQMLKGLALSGVASMTFGGYALAEPFRLGVTRYSVSPPEWPAGLALRIAVITDLHICEPWLGMERLRQIVARDECADAGHCCAAGRLRSRWDRWRAWGALFRMPSGPTSLAKLNAPLGVHAVMGNHDWWEQIEVQKRRSGPIKAQEALVAAGIPVYENDAIRLEKDGLPFWIAGLGDQWAFWPRSNPDDFEFRGDPTRAWTILTVTLEKITDDAPVILMVHEPDIFPEVPKRVSLDACGAYARRAGALVRLCAGCSFPLRSALPRRPHRRGRA